MNKSKITNSILGAIIGDILGVPYEGNKRGTFNCTDMVEGGTWGQPLGSWSDDSSMMLATIDSIIECKQINVENIMRKFVDWYNYDRYTTFNYCFDIGGTCLNAILKYMGTPNIKAIDCGGTNEYSNGNGALMRILPLAFTNADENLIKQVCAITHNHTISHSCCLTYIKIARGLLQDNNFDRTQESKNIISENPYIRNVFELKEQNIKSGGYVVDTLEATLWCLINSNSYEECVLKAVNLGSDTDTTACVAGGLAGLKFQYIPNKWYNCETLTYPKTLIENFINSLDIHRR